MEVTRAYLARQVDEITLQQADVVLVLQQEDGERAGQGRGAGRSDESGGPGEGPERTRGRLTPAPGPGSSRCTRPWWPDAEAPGSILFRGHLQVSPRDRTKSEPLGTVSFPSGWRLALPLLAPQVAAQSWLERAQPPRPVGAGHLPEHAGLEPGPWREGAAVSVGRLAPVSPGQRAGVPTSGPPPGPGPCPDRPRRGAGWLYGERLRDGETGWFPEDFAQRITNRGAVEGNVRRLQRLRVETDV